MAKKKTVREVMIKKDDVTIPQAAKMIERSYSWVYARLVDIGRSNVVRYKGVIFIRAAGLDKLAAMSARAPKRGRPKVVVNF